MAHEAGKGSRPRPSSVSREVFDQRWEQVFGRRETAIETPKEVTVNECLADIDDSEQVGP